MMYLFHNVYGDADGLVGSCPKDVVCVPFGWSEEVETRRNDLLSQLGAQVSRLPSLVFLRDGLWVVLALSDLPTPWSWSVVLAEAEAWAVAGS
jgi:hypothetical protein